MDEPSLGQRVIYAALLRIKAGIATLPERDRYLEPLLESLQKLHSTLGSDPDYTTAVMEIDRLAEPVLALERLGIALHPSARLDVARRIDCYLRSWNIEPDEKSIYNLLETHSRRSR